MNDILNTNYRIGLLLMANAMFQKTMKMVKKVKGVTGQKEYPNDTIRTGQAIL